VSHHIIFILAFAQHVLLQHKRKW